MSPILRAKRLARERNPKTYDPIRRARRVSRRVARNRPIRKPEVCKPTPPAGIDAVTGWSMYSCGGGVLLVPSPRCVGPECKGGKLGKTPTIGFAGDLDEGSRGSFMSAGRLVGITAFDGVEVQKGLAQIDQLRDSGQIDGYYAAAAKNAFRNRLELGAPREAPFEEPSGLGKPLAPHAIMRGFRPLYGEDVGPSIRDGCACTPREPDGQDPVSGWLIYYVKGGILLTPTKKCMAGGEKAPSFWRQTWRNILQLSPTMPTPMPMEPPPEGAPLPPIPPPSPQQPPPIPKVYLCLDPRIWPGAWRPQPTPCEAPKIAYPG